MRQSDRCTTPTHTPPLETLDDKAHLDVVYSVVMAAAAAADDDDDDDDVPPSADAADTEKADVKMG